MITITADVTKMNAALEQYIGLASIGAKEAIVKQGTKVAFEWSARLKGIIPAKGLITRTLLGELKSGTLSGVKVRPTARRWAEKKWSASKGAFQTLKGRRWRIQKRSGDVGERSGLNIQALAVRRELAMRESGRGFSSFGARMRTRGLDNKDAFSAHAPDVRSVKAFKRTFKFFGKYRQQLSELGLTVNEHSAHAAFVWGTPRTELGESLLKPRQQSMLSASIRAVTSDIMEYVRRKLSEAKGKARL